jgi:hypothetical protein
MIESGSSAARSTRHRCDFADTEGTLHFQHLKKAGGGLLHLAGDPTSTSRNGAVVGRSQAARRRARDFIRAFIRPHDSMRPRPIVVAELERFGAAPGWSP